MRLLKAGDLSITDLAFSPDGRAIAASDQHQVYLWNLENASPSRIACGQGDFQPKGGLRFSADGRTLSWLAVSHYETHSGLPYLVRGYNRDSREHTVEKIEFVKDKRWLRVAHSPDGSRSIASSGMPDFRLYGYRFDSEQGRVQTWTLSAADRSVETPTLSADGRLFAILTRTALGEGWANNPRRVEIRDFSNSGLLGTGEYPYKIEAKRFLFSPDNRYLAGINQMNLLMWQIDQPGGPGIPLRLSNTNRQHFTAMAFHPAGRRLYLASNGDAATDVTVHVVDTAAWMWVDQFSWGLGDMKAVVVSADGTLAAAASDRGEIVMWDVDD